MASEADGADLGPPTFMRVKSFETVRNFRDFGGYPTNDGRRVRTDLLFRSGDFAQCHDADRGILDKLGVTLVADLRRSNERTRDPAQWPAKSVQVLIDDDTGIDAEPPHIAFLASTNLTAESVDAFMRGTYCDLPYLDRHLRLFGAFLRGMDAMPNGSAALVHCAHGKDRTGILVAIVLAILGVSDELILDDYELTNQSVNAEESLLREHAKISKMLGYSPPIEALKPMVGVARSYLANALDEIRTRDGSIDAYLDNLGVDGAMRGRLRDRFLTDV